MPHIEYREYRPQDADSFLRLHDSIFPPIAADYWADWSRGLVTASVAIMDGEVVGTVPFCFRDFRIRPDAVARVAWEFSVGVREDLRGTGVGSRLMDTAKHFLRGRCAAMMVYRGDEQSAGYRYYHRNGHQDLLYARTWTPSRITSMGTCHNSYSTPGRPCDESFDGSASGISVGPVETITWEEFLADGMQYLGIFASAYGTYGGYPQRYEGFYQAAVNTIQYHEVPLRLRVVVVRDAQGQPQGYTICGGEGPDRACHMVEIATRDGNLALATRLLATFVRLAASERSPALAMTSDGSPYVSALKALGFEPAARSADPNMIMAYPLDPEDLAAAVWRESAATANLEVVAWTPHREIVLHRARAGSQRARHQVLEMKEDTLARLLFSRLDLAAAVRQETVTVLGADGAAVEAIAQALPYTPWVYHYLDQI